MWIIIKFQVFFYDKILFYHLYFDSQLLQTEIVVYISVCKTFLGDFSVFHYSSVSYQFLGFHFSNYIIFHSTSVSQSQCHNLDLIIVSNFNLSLISISRRPLSNYYLLLQFTSSVSQFQRLFRFQDI